MLNFIANSYFDILVDWWHSYGGRAIELQRFAKRVVSLCASSSGCERNWSTFEFVSQFLVSLCLVSRCVAYMLGIDAFVDAYKEKKPVATQKIE